jgi:hypothetical protein
MNRIEEDQMKAVSELHKYYETLINHWRKISNSSGLGHLREPLEGRVHKQIGSLVEDLEKLKDEASKDVGFTHPQLAIFLAGFKQSSTLATALANTLPQRVTSDEHVTSDTQSAEEYTQFILHLQLLAEEADGYAEQIVQSIGESGPAFPDPPPRDESIKELISLPIATTVLGGEMGGSSRGGSGNLGQSARDAIAKVLGRRPRLDDPASFVSALNANFSTREFEGRTVTDYQPKGYLGGPGSGSVVSGAQASIFIRAQGILENALELLQRVEPLSLEPDEDDIAISRGLITDDLSALVAEIGNEGGPRQQKIDLLFNKLTGTGLGKDYDTEANLGGTKYGFGGGEVGRLAELLGFDSEDIENVSDEQNVQDYRSFQADLAELLNACNQLRDDNNSFLGIRLVKLSRCLEAVSESIEELEGVMDSVNIGPIERRNTQIKFTTGAMSVADFLSWVSDFSAGQGINTVRGGNTHSVKQLASTVVAMDGLAKEWGTPGKLAPSFEHPRVKRSLGELSQRLSDASGLVNDFTK